MNLPPMQSFWLNKERAASIAVDVPETGLPTANVGVVLLQLCQKRVYSGMISYYFPSHDQQGCHNIHFKKSLHTNY